MRNVVWLLGAAIPALLVALLLATAPYRVPPPEALDEYPGFSKWKVFMVQVKEDDTAVLRLRHPENAHVIAVLHYRLVYASVQEEP